MDYLWWEYSPHKFYEADLSMRDSSPCLEVSLCSESKAVINPRLRFGKIFLPVLRSLSQQGNDESAPQEFREFPNCLLHFLARLDRLCGLSAEALQEEQLERELLQGCFGACARELFSRLTHERKQLIVQFLRQHEASGGRRLYFREAVKAVFPQAGIYFYQPDEVFLLYLPPKENEADRDCITLLGILFLDVTAKLQLYWEYPFGIIGRKSTMRLNGTRLYEKRKEA